MNETRPGTAAEPTTAELLDNALRKLVTGLVLAAALIALAVYARPAPPRYQAVAADGRILRIDTGSGTIIACEAGQCATILQRGQHLEGHLSPRPLPARSPQPAQAPALPAPAAAPPAR